jgi:hypothetical protein
VTNSDPRRLSLRGLWLLGLVLAAGLLIVMSGPAPARAQDGTPSPVLTTPVPPGYAEALQALQRTDAAESPAASATPTPTPTEAPPGCSWNQVMTCVTNFLTAIQFDFSTMFEAVITMSSAMLRGAYEAVTDPFRSALRQVLFGTYGLATNLPTALFDDVIFGHWQLTMALAAALLPITLALTCVEAQKQGAASVLSVAKLREALVTWGLSAGGAVASYYVFRLIFRLSISSAHWIVTPDGPVDVVGRIGDGFFPAAILDLLRAVALNPMGLGPIAMILGGFLLFLAISLLMALLLALAAVIVMIYLVTVLAPLMLVLGQLEPLRWLQGLWLKSATIALLLPPANALLLRLAAELVGQVGGDSSWGTAIVALITVTGVVSILITINYKVGQGVFDGIQHVGAQYLQALTDVGRLVVATGVVLASAGAGAPIGAALGLGGAVSGGATSGPTPAGADTGSPGAGGDPAPRSAATPAAGAGVASPSSSPASGSWLGTVAARLIGASSSSGAESSAADDDHLAKFRSLSAERQFDGPVRETADAKQVATGLQVAGNLLARSSNGALRLAGEATGSVGRAWQAHNDRRTTLLERDQDLAERAVSDARYADNVERLRRVDGERAADRAAQKQRDAQRRQRQNDEDHGQDWARGL